MKKITNRHCEEAKGRRGNPVQLSQQRRNWIASSLTLLAMTITLTACVDREDADTKLGMGCVAGIQAILPEGHSLKQLKSTNFNPSTDIGADYRSVKMQFTDYDGFAEADREATCVFHEQFGFMSAGYAAQLYQLKMDDQVWGKQGDQIVGSPEENLKLHERVDEALNQTAPTPAADAPPANAQ